MATVTLSVGRGMHRTLLADHYKSAPVKFAWTNANLTGSTVAGTDILTLILNLLISTGTGNNYSGSGTNYDRYQAGVGLGIPQSLINIAAFEAIRSQNDWDGNLQWAGLWVNIGLDPGASADQSAAVRALIQDDLCKCVGIYLATDNNGLITCVRPKNPTKFHISKANNTFTFKSPTAGTTYNPTVAVGVYSPTELASTLQTALAAAHDTWTVTYNTGTNKFTVTDTANSWDQSFGTSVSTNAWKTVGYTSAHVGTAVNIGLPSDSAVGALPSTTLTENDMWGVRVLPSRKLQISAVVYNYDWSPSDTQYLQQREYLVAEDVNIGTPLGAQTYVVGSKGLFTSESTISPTPLAFWTTPVSGCDPVQIAPAAGTGVDADSMTLLVPSMLLDRYHRPPLAFASRLKWKHNYLELGDNVTINYQVANVFVDRELDANVLTNRVFEVTKVSPNPAGGYVDAEFLGHRSSTSPTPVIATVGTTS